VEKIEQRYTTEVLFGRLKPDQAAQRFVDEVDGQLNK
jgi:multiple sugar transport system substrate-binding protein